MNHDTAAFVDRAWREHRRVLLDVAYRTLGSFTEAEDAVSEAYVRLSRADHDRIRDVRAWLVVTTTRICLDLLTSARFRRETYVGPWFPDPLLGDDADPADRVTLDDSVRMALMVVLEQMTPAERVAFVLHDVFGYQHAEIAEIVGRTTEASRQLVSRARRRLQADRAARVAVDREHGDRVAQQFADAAQGGDTETLIGLLDPDVRMQSDAGGKLTAARRPLHGPTVLLRLLELGRRWYPRLRIEAGGVNGGPGLYGYDGDRLICAAALTVVGGTITDIHAVLNPDKLPDLASGSATPRSTT